MLVDVGDRLRASVQFMTSDTPSVLTDPSTIVVVIDGPGANVNTYTYPDAHIVRDTTGTYHTDFTVAEKGRWWVRWDGTGTLTASAALNFLVSQGAV